MHSRWRGRVFCYLAIGSFVNYKYREMRGVQMVPQLEYWKQLPGLVKDGCLFSKEQASSRSALNL